MSHPPPRETTLRPRLPVDLRLTFSELRFGPGDPTMRREADGSWWRATRTPLGPATMHVAARAGELRVSAWGDGAEWALDAAPDIVGATDSLDGFAPKGRLAELHRRLAGLRITRTRAVYEAALGTALEQLVTSEEAHTAFRAMVRAWGEPAPGPGDLLLPLAPEVLARRAYFELRPFGVEMKRANTLREIARRAPRIDEAAALTLADARERLLAIAGIGPWTAAKVALVALGDADAVPLGDYHLPHAVTYAFTGQPRADDARMLELLAPFAGHRGRVIRLIMSAGISAPRFGPRKRLAPRRTSH